MFFLETLHSYFIHFRLLFISIIFLKKSLLIYIQVHLEYIRYLVILIFCSICLYVQYSFKKKVDDMIADLLSNKKRKLIVTKLFIRGRKLNIFIVFIKQSCFTLPKNIRLN